MRPIGHDGYHPTSVAEWLDSIELGDYTKAFLINGYTSMDLLKKIWELELINVSWSLSDTVQLWIRSYCRWRILLLSLWPFGHSIRIDRSDSRVRAGARTCAPWGHCLLTFRNGEVRYKEWKDPWGFLHYLYGQGEKISSRCDLCPCSLLKTRITNFLFLRHILFRTLSSFLIFIP